MRILRLIHDGAYALEFHPYVTVVTGLDDDQRAEIIEAFRGAATGRAASLAGLIEAHGVVLDLDRRSLQLLELEGLDVDLVVGVDDLPGAATSGVGRQLRAAERRLAELDEPQLQARKAVEDAESRADEAQRTLESLRQRVADAEAAADAPDPELDALEASWPMPSAPSSRWLHRPARPRAHCSRPSERSNWPSSVERLWPARPPRCCGPDVSSWVVAARSSPPSSTSKRAQRSTTPWPSWPKPRPPPTQPKPRRWPVRSGAVLRRQRVEDMPRRRRP